MLHQRRSLEQRLEEAQGTGQSERSRSSGGDGVVVASRELLHELECNNKTPEKPPVGSPSAAREMPCSTFPLLITSASVCALGWRVGLLLCYVVGGAKVLSGTPTNTDSAGPWLLAGLEVSFGNDGLRRPLAEQARYGTLRRAALAFAPFTVAIEKQLAQRPPVHLRSQLMAREPRQGGAAGEEHEAAVLRVRVALPDAPDAIKHPEDVTVIGGKCLMRSREMMANGAQWSLAVSTACVRTAPAVSSLVSVCKVNGRLQSGTASSGWVISAITTAGGLQSSRPPTVRCGQPLGSN